MKLEHIAFALIVLLGLLFYGAPLITEPPGGHGAPHPDIGSMLVGGEGPERHAPILWVGWAIGGVQILFLAAVMLLGGRKGDDLRGLGRPVAIGTTVYLAVWTGLILAYRAYMTDPDPALYAALPAPTAWMLYALWPIPIVFGALFFFGFRRWVLTEQDERAFQQLVARRRARQAEQEAPGREKTD